MLENLRYRIALYFIKKASVQIERGEIQKGMNNFKRSIWIVPPSKELSEFGDRLRQTAESHLQTILSLLTLSYRLSFQIEIWISP